MHILKKEIISFFGGLGGIITFLLITITTSLLTWVFPVQWNVLSYSSASLVPFFSLLPVIFSVFVPAITMRSFAEEKKTGTIEILLTLPIPIWKIIIEKFLAYLFIIFLFLITTLPYPVTIYFTSMPTGNIDTGEMVASYGGIFLSASFFIAIGLWASSLTDNTLIAFILGISICLFFYYGFELISSIVNNNNLKYILSYCGIYSHINSISRGVIDTREVVYFIVGTAFFIYLTWRAFSK